MTEDFLTDHLISWRGADDAVRVSSLPAVLARLGEEGVLRDFPRLRPHQYHPWCMFLAQLAAIALRRSGGASPRRSEDSWRAMLLALTARRHEPWNLIVPAPENPALFQPPVPECVTRSWGAIKTPDDLDVLCTAKNHDVKTGQMTSTDPEAWLYALVTLQTSQGYPGRGYNGVARMNGGFGNRPRVGLANDQTPGARFVRDVATLLDTWPLAVERFGYRDDGVGLTWLVPWDGSGSLAAEDLTPHFIEVCWRVRMERARTGLQCRYTTTQRRRCLPEVDTGDVGDPWIPVDRARGAALTVGPRGYDYRLLARLLFGSDYQLADAQVPRSSDPDSLLFVASAMVRGQGKTDGLHERTLLVAGAARRLLGQPEERVVAGRRATEWVAVADKMRSRVLFPGLKQVALGGKVVQGQFDQEVDGVFFDLLFAGLDEHDDPARIRFETALRDIARRELQRAIDSCAVPDVQRFRMVTAAEAVFSWALKKHFPDLAVGSAG